MTNPTPQELIEKYRLTLLPERGADAIQIGRMAGLTAELTAELKARKPELLAALRDEARKALPNSQT